MSSATLERLISNYMRTPQPQYIFMWQGGEPTLAGVEFYRQAVELQERYAPEDAIIMNCLQTNGILLNQEFAAFLGDHHFLVGVSLDGPQDIHDCYRKSSKGRGSHADVMKGIEHLRRYSVKFNILTMVHSANVRHGKDIYAYLCSNGFTYHQYIPCVEFDDHGKPLPATISGEEWGNFLCDVFDSWAARDLFKVSVRQFDSVLSVLVNGQTNSCTMEQNCCQYFVVESRGDVYPCDFFVTEGNRLGNIFDSSLKALTASPLYLAFGSRKAAWCDKCGNCLWLKLCAGDCLKHRIILSSGLKSESWLCEGWKRYYQHAFPIFQQIAKDMHCGLD